ncbi:MAG: T9SS type A sorting domain-containing protein [Bacteroidetes bacterium]|nr:T9SS type A sorting domain-containing protein [Bacteroidota bacterium]
MRKLAGILTLVFLFLTVNVFAQPVNGVIIGTSNGITIVKLWGTHQERGYAYGYLLGAKISVLAINYVKPMLGGSYTSARNMVSNPNDFSIDTLYKIEAQGIIDGMNASQTNTGNLDYIDLLVANSLLDVMAVAKKKLGMGCSSLMSWEDATMGTALSGESAITRHLDWNVNANLINNQVMVIHLPSEPDEQKWALVGFAGMFSALSGFNQDVGVFQHQMDDLSAVGTPGQQYVPVWFSLREALEKNDFNGDGSNNVQDVRSVLMTQTNGFADGYIVSALARSTQVQDTLVAMVSELAPTAPKLTFRYNTLPDSMPGDNLYTANYQIGRNNQLHFCTRYNAVKSHIGNGTGLDLDAQWNLMRDYSHLTWNLQFMQYSPEQDFFRLSVYTNGQAAYLNTPVTYSLATLFQDATGVNEQESQLSQINIFPNPFSNRVTVTGLGKATASCEMVVTDVRGNICLRQHNTAQNDTVSFDLSGLSGGVYFIKVVIPDGTFHRKIIRIPSAK